MKKAIFAFLSVFLGLFLFVGPILAREPSLMEIVPRLNMPYLGDVYLKAGEKIELDGDILSDAYVAGGEVEASGRIRGDLLAAGGEVKVEGQVDQDLRVVGGEVLLDGIVGRNVAVAGGRVVVGDKARIAGSLVAAGGEVKLSNMAQIGGKKYIRTSSHFNDVGKAQVADQVKIFLGALSLAAKVIKWLSTLLVGLLLIALFPKTIQRLGQEFDKKIGEKLIWGLVASIVLPVLAAVAIFTIIGFPIGLFAIVLLAIGWYLARLLAMAFTGFYILEKTKEKRFKLFGKEPNLYLSFLLGLVIFLVLGLIPFLGWLVKLGLIWISFGVLIQEKLAQYRRIEK